MTPKPPKFKSISPEHAEIIRAYERLFLPHSKEFYTSTYEEKKQELSTRVNEQDYKINPEFILISLYSDVIYKTTSEVDDDGEENFNREEINSPLSYEIQILGPGLYLNKCIDPTFKFPDSYGEFLSIWSELEEIKDKRKKKYKKIEEIRSNKVKFYSRELFDRGDGGSRDISGEKKRDKLKLINENGITPLELLYAHCIEYSEMKNYGHVVREAPNSAFALCWEKGEWV